MILTAILNAILALGVIVMVVTPLVWAILTQHRDHPRSAATDGGPARVPQSAATRVSLRHRLLAPRIPRPASRGNAEPQESGAR
jgi:hypothetical protein